MRASRAIVLLVVACGLAGCGGSGSSSAPSPVPQVAQQVVQPASSPVSGITGFVLDTAFRPLAGARVEVVDGSSAGASTTADGTGQFLLPGTFVSTDRFRATREGYVAATQTWSCSVGSCPGGTGARPWLGFYLALLAPPVNIAGDYTLTFIADGACVDLPNELRMRTYAATITPTAHSNIPSNTSFNVAVSGAQFLGKFNSFGIGVAGDYLGFWLDGGHDPPVVEQLATNTYLAISGVAAASVETPPASTISTSFDGWIEYCVLKSPMGDVYNCGTSNWTGEPIPGAAVVYSHCESKAHRLILRRR